MCDDGETCYCLTSISSSLCTFALNSVFTVSWLGGIGTIFPAPERAFVSRFALKVH